MVGVASVCLEIYVEKGCHACRRSLALAAEVQRRFPEVPVRVVDISSGGGRHRRLITATPTFILNGTTFSLGNPSAAELERAISRLLSGSEGDESLV